MFRLGGTTLIELGTMGTLELRLQFDTSFIEIPGNLV